MLVRDDEEEDKKVVANAKKKKIKKIGSYFCVHFCNVQ